MIELTWISGFLSLSSYLLLTSLISIHHLTSTGMQVKAFTYRAVSLTNPQRERYVLCKDGSDGRGCGRLLGKIPEEEEESEGEDDPLIFPDPYTFLGKGPDAIVRPGVVLVPPVHEYSHFLMKSAVYVFSMGYDSNGVGLIRGVCLDNPTAFTMKEMVGIEGELGDNILFRGGDFGNEAVMMLHSCGQIYGSEYCSDVIGNSGIYEGGMKAAIELVSEGQADPKWFKFFFNYIEFTEDELNKILGELDDSNDAWMSIQVPPSFILEDHDKNEVRIC